MAVLGMDDNSKQEQEWNLRSKKAWTKSKATTKWKVWPGEKIQCKWWRYKNDKQTRKDKNRGSMIRVVEAMLENASQHA